MDAATAAIAESDAVRFEVAKSSSSLGALPSVEGIAMSPPIESVDDSAMPPMKSRGDAGEPLLMLLIRGDV